MPTCTASFRDHILPIALRELRAAGLASRTHRVRGSAAYRIRVEITEDVIGRADGARRRQVGVRECRVAP